MAIGTARSAFTWRKDLRGNVKRKSTAKSNKIIVIIIIIVVK
jgi:hypothetical protein